jgi:hypothetical protein
MRSHRAVIGPSAADDRPCCRKKKPTRLLSIWPVHVPGGQSSAAMRTRALGHVVWLSPVGGSTAAALRKNLLRLRNIHQDIRLNVLFDESGATRITWKTRKQTWKHSGASTYRNFPMLISLRDPSTTTRIRSSY